VALAVVIAACAARTWARNGDYRDNFVMSEAGVRTQPKSSKMHYNLAVELDKRGRYEEALAHAVESFQLRTSGLESRELSATLLRKLGRRDRAITFLRTVVTGDPTDRRSRELLIEVLDEAGRGAEADSVIESAMVLDAAQVTWPAMAALRAQERGEWARAAALWRGVTVRDPASVHALQNLGFCLLRSGDPAAAATAYRTALERSPTSHSAANGLAWCILESNGPAEDAVRLAESAVNASPSEFYYDTLARAYLEAGDCEGALSAAERAVALHAGPGAEFDQRLREVQERCRRPE
jgi:Flp pilus assembly protein TadD